MGTWINDDGLVIRFGVEEAVLRNIGAYRTHGPRRFVEVIVDPANRFFPEQDDGFDEEILNDQFAIPAGAFIESVEIMTYEDFTGTGVLSVGLTAQDRALTGATHDDDALVDEASVANLNAGGTNVAAWVGSLVGETLDEARLLTWKVDTADLAGGKATIRVRWSVPPKTEDTLAWDKS